MDDISEFYRDRIKLLQEERKIFDHYLSLVNPMNADILQFEWENRQEETYIKSSQDQKEKLDLEYSTLQIQLRDLDNEYENIKHKREVVKSQIEKLQHLVIPVEHDISYIVNEIQYSKNGPNTVKDVDSSHSNPSKVNPIKISSKILPKPNKSKVLNNITKKRGRTTHRFIHSHTNNKDNDILSYYMQSSNNENRNQYSIIPVKMVKDGEVCELERTLQEITTQVEDSIGSLLIELVDVDDACRLLSYDKDSTIIQLKEEVNNLIESIEKSEYECFSSVSEILRLRYEILVLQREEVEEGYYLRQDEIYYKEQEILLNNKFIQDIEVMKQNMESELYQLKYTYQIQYDELHKRLKKVQKMKQENEKFLKSNKLEKLRKSVKDNKEQYEKLCKRNELEIEGYQSEINILRQRYKQLLHKRDIQRKKKEKLSNTNNDNDIDVSKIKQNIKNNLLHALEESLKVK